MGVSTCFGLTWAAIDLCRSPLVSRSSRVGRPSVEQIGQALSRTDRDALVIGSNRVFVSDGRTTSDTGLSNLNTLRAWISTDTYAVRITNLWAVEIIDVLYCPCSPAIGWA